MQTDIMTNMMIVKCLNDIEVEVSEIRKQINTKDLLVETASWVEMRAKVEKIVSDAFDRAEGLSIR